MQIFLFSSLPPPSQHTHTHIHTYTSAIIKKKYCTLTKFPQNLVLFFRMNYIYRIYFMSCNLPPSFLNDLITDLSLFFDNCHNCIAETSAFGDSHSLKKVT